MDLGWVPVPAASVLAEERKEGDLRTQKSVYGQAETAMLPGAKETWSKQMQDKANKGLP